MKLVCVVGPTGCGKTWLGVELAKMLGGEVVSCDSMQIYRGMAIGTAAPTAEEMQGIPHHMVGVADPRENYSVARYADDAAKCVDDILSRGKQPVIVGGTGLYLNALLAGHGFAGGDKDGRYRAELESRWDKEGSEAMFVELRRIDPETAGNLHLNDKKRILRALEVYYETGKTMAQHNAETKLIPPRYDSVRIGLAYADRDDMKRAIDLRVDKMVEAGLFDEVRALPASMPSASSRGCGATPASTGFIGKKRGFSPIASLFRQKFSIPMAYPDFNADKPSAKKKGKKSHEKNRKPSGPISPLCAPQSHERDGISRQRLPDARRHHGL